MGKSTATLAHRTVKPNMVNVTVLVKASLPHHEELEALDARTIAPPTELRVAR